jgi:hypothetical protein
LSEPACGACVAQHSTEVLSGANPIRLCAHINTEYRNGQMCQ